MMGMKRRLRAGSTLLVMLLVATGCGSRVDAGPTIDADLPPDQVAAPPAESGRFGTIANPCGPNTTDAPLGDGARGVTASTITISTISDPGGAKPGLNQSVFDAMVAFTDWCNELGGINGRRLVLQQRDGKLTQYKDRAVEACQDSFALVGSVGVFDDTGVDDLTKCNLINVPGAAIGNRTGEDPHTFQPVPLGKDLYSAGPARWIKRTFPSAFSKAGTAYTNIPVVAYQNQRRVAAFEQEGFTYLERRGINVNESAWAPVLFGMKNDGVEYLNLTSSYEEILPMLKELNLMNYRPEVIELDPNFYDNQFPEQAKAQGIDVGNSYVTLAFWPFEEADQNPATRTFVDAVARSVPDADPTGFGVLSFSAALLFATAAKAAGADLTPERLLAELQKIDSWDGGGLHGPTSPAKRIPPACFVMVKVTADGFRRAYPMPGAAGYDNPVHAGMDCADENLITLEAPPAVVG